MSLYTKNSTGQLVRIDVNDDLSLQVTIVPGGSVPGSTALQTATVSDLIRGSLRLLGAIASGETPSASEMQDALSALKQLLDSWNTEKLIAYTVQREVFALTGASSYTIGPGGDFDTVRPLRIDYANYEDEGIEFPVEILTFRDRAECGARRSDNYPSISYQPTVPLGSLSAWLPSTATNLILYTTSQLSQFNAITDSLLLPPGYFRALRYGLAIELAPEYGKSVSGEIAETYNNSKASIKRLNMQPIEMKCDAALLSSGPLNIYTGSY